MGNLCIKSQINICKICNNKITNINSTICDVCNHNIELNKKKLNDNEIDQNDNTNNEVDHNDDTNYKIDQTLDTNEIDQTSDTNNEISQNSNTFDKKYIKCTKIVLKINQKISIALE